MHSWTVVIPVKGDRLAKSRFGAGDNTALALAMALDTVGAALSTPAVERVIVVTLAARAPFADLGAEVVVDPAGGLNAAINVGVNAATRAGASDMPSRALALSNVAILLGDLPALRSTELAAALEGASRHPLAIVADADATGTTLATATAEHPHTPLFGFESRVAHLAAGYVELTGAWPGLRRDVDVPKHLEGLRLGPRTRAALGLSGRKL